AVAAAGAAGADEIGESECGCRHGGTHDPRLVPQLGRNHLTVGGEAVGEVVEPTAHAAADDDQVGRKHPLQVVEVLVDPGRPLLPRQSFPVPGAGGGPVLYRLVTMEVEVAQLAVGHEDTVGEYRTADTRSEGE